VFPLPYGYDTTRLALTLTSYIATAKLFASTTLAELAPRLCAKSLFAQPAPLTINPQSCQRSLWKKASHHSPRPTAATSNSTPKSVTLSLGREGVSKLTPSLPHHSLTVADHTEVQAIIDDIVIIELSLYTDKLAYSMPNILCGSLKPLRVLPPISCLFTM
jgi:hypothetical protein